MRHTNGASTWDKRPAITAGRFFSLAHGAWKKDFGSGVFSLLDFDGN
jgi:hypothetical protein